MGYSLEFPTQDSFCFVWYIPLCLSFTGVLFSCCYDVLAAWIDSISNEQNDIDISTTLNKNVIEMYATNYKHKIKELLSNYGYLPPDISMHILSYLSIETEEWKILYYKSFKYKLFITCNKKLSTKIFSGFVNGYIWIRFILLVLCWYIIIDEFTKFVKDPNACIDCNGWDYFVSFSIQVLYIPSKITLFYIYLSGKSDDTVDILENNQSFCFYIQTGTFTLELITWVLSIIGYVVTIIIPGIFCYFPLAAIFLLSIAIEITIIGFLDRDSTDTYYGLQVAISFTTWLFHGWLVSSGIATICLYTGENWVYCFKYGYFGKHCSNLFTFDANWRNIILFISWIIV